MSLKCEYCPKSFTGLNQENINRHNNKHINKKHQKITNIKPINSFLTKTVPKQAATSNLASLLNNQNEIISLDDTLTGTPASIEPQNSNEEDVLNLNNSFNNLANLLDINNLRYEPNEQPKRPEKRKKFNLTLSSNNSSMRITFKKCKGFHYSQSGHNIFLEFPFQRFFIDQLPFVFENKNFHTQRCSKASYCYTSNELSDDISRDCFNLQFNSQFKSIFESYKNENSKYLNRKYLNYNLFLERLESKDHKISILTLENLNREFKLICYKNQIDLC